MVETLIAVYVHDNIVRPYVGDFLVVIMIYCFVRVFFKISVHKAAISTLLFAYLIELLQYLRFIEYARLQGSRFANTILGNQFEWIDMLAYTLGIMFVLIIERFKLKRED